MASVNVLMSASYANLTSGRITYTPLESFLDSTGKIVQGGIPFPSVSIISGSASFNIPSTGSTGIGYRFRIESGTSPTFIFIDEFEAVIPDASPQNFNTLLTGFFSLDLVDSSIQATADLLSKDPYLTRISNRIPGFNFKPYTTSQVFQKNDFTIRGDRYYQWIKTIAGTNTDPLTAANRTDPGNYQDGVINASASWQVASPSLTGSGTTTSILPYNYATFAALKSQPSSRKNLTELEDLLRNSISQPDLSSYAQKNVNNAWTAKQTFSANASGVTQSYGTSNSDYATTAFVQFALEGKGFNLSNRFSIVEERKNQGIDGGGAVSGVNVRNLNTIQRNGGDINSVSGSLVTIKAGIYFMLASAVSNRGNGNKLYLWDNANANGISTRSLSAFTGSNLVDSASQNVESTLQDVITLTADTPCTLRHEYGSSAPNDGLGKASNRPGYSEMYSRLVLFRLS